MIRSPQPQPLPAPLDGLVGRESELAATQRLLVEGQARLLTLIGPGGVGKTRLAAELAQAARPHFHDGVWFVDLSGMREAEAILPAVARLFGLRDSKRPAAEVLEHYLGPKRLLIALDNLEHLPGAEVFVARLLASGPGVRVLATSREPLRLGAEQRFLLHPLGYPEVPLGLSAQELLQFPAIRLFLERATLVMPDFAFTDAALLAVARLCARLDGLPLALELVAARADLLSPEAMVQRLEAGEPLPTASLSDAPERHRSLGATVAWSYSLLSVTEQMLLRRLAVFEGGCSLAAARAVADTAAQRVEALGALAALTDRSLLRALNQGSEPRFGMLETIRTGMLEQLAQSGEVLETATRHAEYFTHLAEETEPKLRGPEQIQCFERLEMDLENFRAALRWTQAQRPDLGLRLCVALWRFWDARGYRAEGRGWLEAQLRSSGESGQDISTARARLVAGALALEGGDYPTATAQIEASLEAFHDAGDGAGVADAMSFLGTVAYTQLERERAETLYTEALKRKRQLADRHGMAELLVSLGMLQGDRGEYEAAERMVEEGLALQRQVKNLTGIASSLLRLGSLVTNRGALDRAETLFQESYTRFKELGHYQGAAAALIGLGDLASQRGDSRAAAAPWAESLRLLYRIGQPYGVSWCLEALAEVAIATGAMLTAAHLIGAGAALRRTIGLPDDPEAQQTRQQHSDLIRAALGETEASAALLRGEALPLDQAVEEALAFEAGLRVADLSGETTDIEAASPEDSPRPARDGFKLSQRETEVLRLVTEGLSNKQIARTLGVSDNTVKFHLTSVFNKFGCHTRAQATRMAAELGLLEPAMGEAG